MSKLTIIEEVLNSKFKPKDQTNLIDDKIAFRQIRVSEKRISRRNLNEKDNFKYVNNYCDYTNGTFYLEPLMQ